MSVFEATDSSVKEAETCLLNHLLNELGQFRGKIIWKSSQKNVSTSLNSMGKAVVLGIFS